MNFLVSFWRKCTTPVPQDEQSRRSHAPRTYQAKLGLVVTYCRPLLLASSHSPLHQSSLAPSMAPAWAWLLIALMTVRPCLLLSLCLNKVVQ